MSVRSLSGDDRSALERLQSRIEALEYDNERLRNSSQLASPHPGDALHLENLSKERDEALGRIAQLEAASSSAIDGVQVQVALLEQKNQEVRLTLETQRHDMQCTIDAIQRKLENETDVVRSLQATIGEKETIIKEKSASVSDLMAEIRCFQLKLENLSTELQNEKQDMGAQIDELRMAGQVSISLNHLRMKLQFVPIGNNCPVRRTSQHCRQRKVRAQKPYICPRSWYSECPTSLPSIVLTTGLVGRYRNRQ